MLNKYPDYISGINYKKNGNTSLRLKRLKKTKIFVIGFNKTGTSTLHYYFKNNNIPSIHWGDNNGNLAKRMKKNFDNNKKLLEGVDEYQCYTDMECQKPFIYAHIEYFKLLHKQYPKSKFILNIRDVDNWIKSRLKHKSGKYANYIMKKFKLNKQELINKWKNDFKIHVNNVINFFKNKGNLLIFNIENDKPDIINKFINEYNLNTDLYIHRNKSK